MQGQYPNSLCQALEHDISSPNTMPCHAPKPATWEYIDLSDPDTSQPQQPQHAREPPRYSSTPLPPSGYAYVPPFTVPQPQPQPATKASDKDDDANDGFTEAALFPLPPNHYSYHTFPATINEAPLPNPNHHSPCYFDTLDFSDYQHHHHHHPTTASPLLPPSGSAVGEKGGVTAAAVAVAVPAEEDEEDAYRPRGRGWAAYRDGGGHEILVTRGGLLSSSSSGVGGGVVAGEEAEEKRAWRRVVGVVVVWMVVVGVLVVLQWVVGGGGGRFIDDVSARGDGVHGEWGPCTEARPRFCRLVVGAAEQ